MGRRYSHFRRRWLLPPGIDETLSRFGRAVRWWLSSSRRAVGELLRQNESLRARWRGRRCFVIGNGPSLAVQDIAPLAGEVTLVMNAFYRHPLVAEGFRPTVHCMAEPGGFYGTPRGAGILRQCTAGLSADAHVFPVEARPHVLEQGLLPIENVHFVLMRGEGDAWNTRRRLDLTRPIPLAPNTAHLAIMVAIFAGCSPIYLLGLDHDWLAHRGIDRHFYQPQADESRRDGPTDLASYGYLELMKSSMCVWQDYHVLKQIAARQGCRIYNATEGGFLDVFERIRYEDVIAGRKAA